jgi:hypothetical protein
VPNTKVVANIPIYLHAKFHIFLRYLSISSNYYPTCLKNQKGKGNLKFENHHEPFSSASAQHCSAIRPSMPRSQPAPASLPVVAAKRAPHVSRPTSQRPHICAVPHVGAIFPQIPSSAACPLVSSPRYSSLSGDTVLVLAPRQCPPVHLAP